MLKQALLQIYPAGTEDTEGGRNALEVEIHVRGYWFRRRYVPWLSSFIDLSKARVLEIGAGTGTSAIPLAEAGAEIDSIDISEASLEVAKVRARLHGLEEKVRFQTGNAAEIGTLFAGSEYDLIIYFAALEHMTYPERIGTLRQAWSLLRPGAFLAVADTPNRLWYYDNHSSFTNFFHWLPGEVAVDYAGLTPRDDFKEALAQAASEGGTEGAKLRLARYGRGVSFHEFEIALGRPMGGLTVIGEWDFMRSKEQGWAKAWAASLDGRYHEFLRLVAPGVPGPFLEEELALAILKS